jgi:hypothetical protein
MRRYVPTLTLVALISALLGLANANQNYSTRVNFTTTYHRDRDTEKFIPVLPRCLSASVFRLS